MAKGISIIQTPAEVNKLYCPKCKKVYTGRNKAYLETAFMNKDDFTVHYMLYNDNPFEKDDVKCICPVCKNHAMGVYSECAASFVEEIIGKKWEIISITNGADFDIVGSVVASVHKPLIMTIKIPEAEKCTNSINTANQDYLIEWVEGTVYKLAVNISTLSPIITVHDISKKIYVEKRRCWYYSECAEYIKTIESKGCLCITYGASTSDDDEMYDDKNIFAVIDIKHCNIFDIIKDINIPYGIEIVLKSAGVISIEFKRNFNLDATDKWFASLADKISKAEEA